MASKRAESKFVKGSFNQTLYCKQCSRHITDGYPGNKISCFKVSTGTCSRCITEIRFYNPVRKRFEILC